MGITYRQKRNISLIHVRTCKTYEEKRFVLKNKQMFILEYNELYLDRDHFGVPKAIMPHPHPTSSLLKIRQNTTWLMKCRMNIKYGKKFQKSKKKCILDVMFDVSRDRR